MLSKALSLLITVTLLLWYESSLGNISHHMGPLICYTTRVMYRVGPYI